MGKIVGRKAPLTEKKNTYIHLQVQQVCPTVHRGHSHVHGHVHSQDYWAMERGGIVGRGRYTGEGRYNGGGIVDRGGIMGEV